MVSDTALNDRRARYTVTNPAGQSVFDIDFPLTDENAIKVYIDGIEESSDDYTVDVDALTVTTGSAVAKDKVVVLEGVTPADRAEGFARRGGLDTALLNGDFREIYYILQELRRDLDRALILNRAEGADVSGDMPLFEAGKLLIIDDDSENIKMGPDASDIADAQSNAANAANSANASAASAAAAQFSEEKAQAWAEEDEDVEVEPGQYSAKHHAIKAAAVVEGGASSISYDNTASGMSAENVQDAIDEINTTVDEISTALPIGMPFPVWDHITGVTAPSNSGSEKYIKLTAGEDGVGEYNEGLLTNESVSGTAPLVTATADIDLAGSPLNGQTVHLINSENRYVMPGTGTGTTANDQMQQITGEVSNLMSGQTTTYQGALSSSVGGSPGAGGNNYRYATISLDSANSPDARTGDHTNVKHIQATFYMRIL